MRSLESNGQATGPSAEGLARLLDPIFGLFVWAAHFVVVYVVAAVACVLGLGAGSGARPALMAVLAIGTVATAVLTWLHAARRYRQQRSVASQRFRMALTVGSDAIASIAILWQLFPLLLVPACV